MFGNAVVGQFSGVRIIESPHMQKYTTEPARKHKEHPKRKKYHLRVQKKWNKRFGTVQNPMFIATMGAIFAHPDVVQLLRDKIGNH